MTDYLIPPPPARVLPVTFGADAAFTVQRVDDQGDPLDYDPEAQVYLLVDIDRSNPTKVDATVTGSEAAIRMDYLIADQCRNTTKWQVILKNGDAETAILVGRCERNDG